MKSFTLTKSRRSKIYRFELLASRAGGTERETTWPGGYCRGTDIVFIISVKPSYVVRCTTSGVNNLRLLLIIVVTQVLCIISNL